jgi:hypothetical protein
MFVLWVFTEADARVAVQLLRCEITPDETSFNAAELVCKNSS